MKVLKILVILLMSFDVSGQVRFTSLERSPDKWDIGVAKRSIPGISGYAQFYMSLPDLLDSLGLSLAGTNTGDQNLQQVSDLGGLSNGSTLSQGTTADNGGGGIAMRCSLGYELKWEAGRLYLMEDDGFTIREVSYNFANTPTVNDDITKGYVVNSRWTLDDGDVYLCIDNTDANAVWELQEKFEERIIYTVDITKPSNDAEEQYSLLVSKNNTGINFDFSESTIYAVCAFSDISFIDKILSITWYRRDGIGRNSVFYVDDQLGTLNLPIINNTSIYRLCIEFHNY